MSYCRGEVHFIDTEADDGALSFLCCMCRLNNLHDLEVGPKVAAALEHLRAHRDAGHTSIGNRLDDAIESLAQAVATGGSP